MACNDEIPSCPFRFSFFSFHILFFLFFLFVPSFSNTTLLLSFGFLFFTLLPFALLAFLFSSVPCVWFSFPFPVFFLFFSFSLPCPLTKGEKIGFLLFSLFIQLLFFFKDKIWHTTKEARITCMQWMARYSMS